MIQRDFVVCFQVSQYTTDGLERAMDALNEAAQQRNLYSIGSTVSRRVAAAAATAVGHVDVESLLFSLSPSIP